jgi:hypothetical protein
VADRGSRCGRLTKGGSSSCRSAKSCLVWTQNGQVLFEKITTAALPSASATKSAGSTLAADARPRPRAGSAALCVYKVRRGSNARVTAAEAAGMLWDVCAAAAARSAGWNDRGG